MSDIIDDLMHPDAHPHIISGGPNAQGEWMITVIYLDGTLNQSVEGPAQVAQLNLRQLSEWRKIT